MKAFLIAGCVLLLIMIFVACSRKSDKKTSILEKKYPQSIDEILALPEELDIIFALQEKIDKKHSKSGLESLTPEEIVFLCVEGVQAEVNNGGFYQYFFNSAGDFAQDAPSAFEMIGAKLTAALVREACSVFPNGLPPKDREKRQEQLLRVDENQEKQLCNLDERFYGCKEELDNLLIDFIKKHKEQFK